MDISKGIELIKQFEGCKLQAYPDPATGGDPWTIGYGATGHGISEGAEWTQEQADSDLIARCNKTLAGIEKLVKIELKDEQASALVAFVYNVGIGNFQSSTMLKLINGNELDKAADEFLKWNKAAGHVMSGLTRRRAAERALFLMA